MNRLAIRFASIGAPLLTSVAAAQMPRAAGHWTGSINIPNRAMPLVVDLARSSSGAWIGSVTITGSTSVDVPLEKLAVNDSVVRFTAKLPAEATFDAKLASDTLTGTVESLEGRAPFQLTRSGEANVKVPAPSSKLTKEFEGSWEASIEAPSGTRKIVLRLTPAEDGSATGVLISVNRGMEFPLTTVSIRGKEIDVDVKSISGHFHGMLGESGEIAGEWTEPANRLPITLKRATSAGRPAPDNR